MIEKFEVGKYYVYHGTGQPQYYHKAMDLVCDGRPHKCIKADGKIEKMVLFEGMDLDSRLNGNGCIYFQNLNVWEEHNIVHEKLRKFYDKNT